MSKCFIFMRDIDTSHVAVDKREAWMPKGDLPYFDKVARRTFQSRKEKRAWLKANGMREAGELLNPSRAIQGREKTRPTQEQLRARAVSQKYLQSVGGVNGLLDRLQRKRA